MVQMLRNAGSFFVGIFWCAPKPACPDVRPELDAVLTGLLKDHRATWDELAK